jgi:hypothetical protein
MAGRKLPAVLAVTVVCNVLIGCVAPGSAIGTLAIRGQLLNPGNGAVPEKQVQLVITPEYGLGGLDQYFAKPEDHRHGEHVLHTTTGHDGVFN